MGCGQSIFFGLTASDTSDEVMNERRVMARDQVQPAFFDFAVSSPTDLKG
jgi:hypothetical protein